VKELISDRFWRKPPTRLLSIVFPDVLWRAKSPKRDVVHLTFDDGPSRYTAEISKLLSDNVQKATFFLSGQNLTSYPDSILTLKEDGQGVAYHGHAHIDGWKTELERFKVDFKRSASLIDSPYYRPPYGRLTLSQYNWVKKTHKVVIWDLMPGDFKADRTAEGIVDDILANARSGSIIVLHDNDACGAKVLEALPLLLDGFNKKGLRSEAL
jgi:peptidoglycan/xylan/chitin deacetylase (PgdA/CDA1 family)